MVPAPDFVLRDVSPVRCGPVTLQLADGFETMDLDNLARRVWGSFVTEETELPRGRDQRVKPGGGGGGR